MSTPSDMWRVDVAGYPCTVRGENARKHLEQVNHQLAVMQMALHRILLSDRDNPPLTPEGQARCIRVARETLEGLSEKTTRPRLDIPADGGAFS